MQGCQSKDIHSKFPLAPFTVLSSGFEASVTLSFWLEPAFGGAPRVKSVLVQTSVCIDYDFAGAGNEKMY